MKLNKHMKAKGQIKDRGRIKWTAMMLPEHVQMLREWQQEDRYNVKPCLDEFDLEAIFEEIGLAYKRQCSVEIRVWQNGSKSCSGIVSAIDQPLQQLRLDTGSVIESLSFNDIIGAKTLE